QRNSVRRVERRGLRQHLGEYHDQNGHDDGGVDHADIAEPGEQQAGRQRRSRDVGGVIAEQQRPDHPFARIEQAVHKARLAVVLLLQPRHARARRRSERRLAPGEEGREQDANKNNQQCEPIVASHRSASFFSRKAWTSAASTSGAMKLPPMPRARMNVNAPRLTFLSCAISSIKRSAPGTPPGMAPTRVGSPTAARWRTTRSASPAGSSERLAENSKASAMPIALASRCGSRSEKPAAASSAWPNVWPRLSSARSPVSRSSRPTIAAFMRQLTAMACSRAGPPENTSRQFASSQAKKAASAINPYLATSE